MLKLCTVTKVKVFFLLLVYVFNFDLFEFSAAILERGLLKYLDIGHFTDVAVLRRAVKKCTKIYNARAQIAPHSFWKLRLCVAPM